MALNKKHWTKELKEQNAKLLSDIEKIVNGDTITTFSYKVRFEMRDSLERAIWAGDSSLNINNGIK